MRVKERTLNFDKFGDFLKLKREQLGVTQGDLAKRIGIDRTYLSMLENRGNPAFNKVIEIARALGISVDELFKVEPKEALPPQIQVVFTETQDERKLAERMIAGFTVPVPMVSAVKGLAGSFLEESDIEGYVLFDRTMFDETEFTPQSRFVAVRPAEFPEMRGVIVDLNRKELQEGKVFLLLLNDKPVVRRVRVFNEGVLLTAPGHFPMHELDQIISNKKKEGLKVLGQVITISYRE